MAHSELKLWTFIDEQLKLEQKCMLLTVVNHEGSSPGRTGFKMAVGVDFSFWGSIGGGIMEHKLVDLAHKQLLSSHPKSWLKKQIHQASVAKDKSGMICSGEQTVVLTPLQASDQKAVQQIIEALKSHHECYLQLTPKGIKVMGKWPKGSTFTYSDDNAWNYQEKIGYRDFLHIIGGGHISLALSELANALDFHVSVYDDRPQLHTLQLNQFAHQIEQVDYDRLPPFTTAQKQYLVVMSFGYRTDAQILKQLYPQEFDYFGLLGSTAKLEVLLEELQQDGLSKQWLNHIQAPAGVSISSQTPMEIAVSIAASLIMARKSSL